MQIDKVLWCDRCGYVTMLDETSCPRCGDDLENIGFVEDKQKVGKNTGGSVKRGHCNCGRLRASKGVDSQGRQRYRTNCSTCRYRAQKSKKEQCEHCNAKLPKHLLDVDHIDGDRSNNEETNLQTLCKPCHLTKTRKFKDIRKKNND